MTPISLVKADPQTLSRRDRAKLLIAKQIAAHNGVSFPAMIRAAENGRNGLNVLFTTAENILATCERLQTEWSWL